MLQQRLTDRPVVPVGYLTPLSPYSMGERREMIGVTPVCINMEPESMTITDIIRDIDFGGRKGRRSRSI